MTWGILPDLFLSINISPKLDTGFYRSQKHRSEAIMILVTGATGHIGNVVVRELLVRGKRVRAMVMPGEDLEPLAGLDVQIVEANVLDPAALQKAFKGVGTVYHLAGMISIMPGEYEKMHKVNVEGTRNIIVACRQAHVRRLVYTSSIHALRRIPEGRIVDESVDFDPENRMGDYDRTKAEASLAVLEAARNGLDAVVVCPTGVIGPYDYRRSEMGSLLLEWTRRAPHFLIDGAYDFVDVRDVAKGHVLAAEKGRKGEIYILSGERIELASLHGLVNETTGRLAGFLTVPKNLARAVARIAPSFYRMLHRKPQFTPYSIETVLSNSNISNAKAQRELGYRPRSLAQSVEDTIRWFVENSRIWKTSRQKQ
jgi:dihydroflavonol-4-reductase